MTLDSLLARQAGVISRQQALAAGLSRDTVDHRVRARRWRPLHPAVYLVAGHRLDDEVRVRAALLWAGVDAVLSGLTAAWWFGLLAAPPPRVEVTVGRRRRLRGRVDVEMRRRDLPECDLAVHRGLRVTALPLTAIEAAVALGDTGGPLLDAAFRGRVSFADAHAAYCRNLGSAGSSAACRLLTEAAERSTVTARGELRALLRGSGASGWTEALDVDGHPVDVAFPAARVAVVASGRAPANLLDAGAEVGRTRALLAHGWTVLRFTWQDIVERPHAVLAEIARHVSRGMAVPGRAG